MVFNVLGSNDTIIVVNQTNIGGSTQSNMVLLSGLGYSYSPVPAQAAPRGAMDSYNARA